SPALIKRESGTCPAVLHRHRSTSKDFTGVTQSRPARKADEVSSRPNPRGLTTPAATTATRGFGDFGEEEKSAIFGGGTGPELICFHRQKPLLITPIRKRKLGALVDCQLRFSVAI